MRQFTEKTWEEELIERFMIEGQRRGEERGLRSALRILLQQRFGTLPDELMQRIEAADIDHLRSAQDAIVNLRSLDELKL